MKINNKELEKKLVKKVTNPYFFTDGNFKKKFQKQPRQSLYLSCKFYHKHYTNVSRFRN